MTVVSKRVWISYDSTHRNIVETLWKAMYDPLRFWRKKSRWFIFLAQLRTASKIGTWQTWTANIPVWIAIFLPWTCWRWGRQIYGTRTFTMMDEVWSRGATFPFPPWKPSPMWFTNVVGHKSRSIDKSCLKQRVNGWKKTPTRGNLGSPMTTPHQKKEWIWARCF